jgi:hypothetical protein
MSRNHAQVHSEIVQHKSVGVRAGTRTGGRTYVICSYSINLINLVVERCRFIYDKLQEIVRCGFSCEEFELLVDCPTPCDDDAAGDLRVQVLLG